MIHTVNITSNQQREGNSETANNRNFTGKLPAGGSPLLQGPAVLLLSGG